MRILVISNLYPPHHIGGYELGCQAVVEKLRERRHAVRVLTSDVGNSGQTDDDVHRCLKSDWFRPAAPKHRHLAYLVSREWESPRIVQSQIAAFRPDVIYIWNPVGLSMATFAAAESTGVPVRYFVSDSWLERSTESMASIDAWHSLWSHQWRPPVRWAQPSLQRAARVGDLSPRHPRFDDVHFASDHLRSRVAGRGKTLSRARVIHWGVDTNTFSPGAGPRASNRLLFVGQLARHKGPHTAIEALGILRHSSRFEKLTLDVVGLPVDPTYVDGLHRLVHQLELGAAVRFHGAVARAVLPDVYRSADLLVFPSIWDEPFSITLLEGLASGLAVVATNTGGTPEVVDDGRTGLLFPPGDAAACAARIARLCSDRALSETLSAAAVQRVRTDFTLDRMIDRIEQALGDAAPTTRAERSASGERSAPRRVQVETGEERPAPASLT